MTNLFITHITRIYGIGIYKKESGVRSERRVVRQRARTLGIIMGEVVEVKKSTGAGGSEGGGGGSGGRCESPYGWLCKSSSNGSPVMSSPMKKAMESMQGYLEQVGHFTKLDPQDAWLPITESRNGNAYYSAFHTLSSGIGFQALVLPLAFTSLRW